MSKEMEPARLKGGMVILKFLKILLLGLPIWLGGVVLAGQVDSMVTFRGEIKYQAEGACRGMVSLWPAEGQSAPVPERTNLVPAWVGEIDPECRFEIKALPGSYYLQAVARQTPGLALGPLRVGDLVFSSRIADAQPLQVSGNAGDQLNLGTLAASTVFEGYSAQVETGITGRLIDKMGRPVEGLRVLAFSNAEMYSGLYAVSSPSDIDGWFYIHFTGKAEVYLQAREEIGLGFPPLGSLVGVYGNKSAKLVTVKQGKRVEQVEIVVEPRIKEDAAEK